MMEQLKLLLRDQQRIVSLDVIQNCATFLDALKLCISMSGLEGKQIAGHLNIDPGQWSRILSGDCHFPLNRLLELMDLCANKIPLIWLAVKCGYTLAPLKSELEQENDALKAKVGEWEKKYQHTIEALKAIKGA